MKVRVEAGAGAGAEAEVGKARRGLHFRPALLFGSGPARRRGISIPLTAIILTAALIAITSAVATGSMIYISAAGRGFKDVTISPALVLHETIESIYMSNPGTSATVTLKNELGPITSSPANSSTTVTFPCPLPAAAWYARERRRTRQIISALPSFSRSVAEEVKKGNSPTQAVALISENRIFNPSFNNILRKMAAHVKMGRSIGETAAYVKMPWIARVYFELLDQAEQMGADPKSMDALSDLMNNIHTSMRSLDSETSLFKFSCYINSVILPFSIIIIVDVVVRLFMQVASSVTAISLPAGLSFLRVEDLPLLSLVAYSSVVLDAYLLGLLGGKISDGGSIVDGLKSALICVGIAVATLIILRDLGIVTSLFGF